MRTGGVRGQAQHRAFWMCLANLGIPDGAMSASAVLLALSGNFDTIGRRIAMLLSAVIAIPALLARSMRQLLGYALDGMGAKFRILVTNFTVLHVLG